MTRSLVLITLLCAHAATAATISLPVVMVSPGGTTQLPVTVTDAAGIESVDLRIGYDSTLIAVASDVTLSAMMTACEVSTNRTVAGVLRVALACTNAMTTSGVLFTVSIAGIVVGAAPVSLSGCMLNEDAIPCATVGGSVVVAWPTATATWTPTITPTPTRTWTPTPTVTLTRTPTITSTPTPPPPTITSTPTPPPTLTTTPTRTATPPPTSTITATVTLTPTATNTPVVFRICDVTRNGGVSAFDAAWTLQFVAGLRALDVTERLLADASGNGSVSTLDASYMLRFVVGDDGGKCGTAGSP